MSLPWQGSYLLHQAGWSDISRLAFVSQDFLELSCAFRSVVWSRELVSLDASKTRQGFYAFQNADLRNLRSPDTCVLT